MDILVVTDKLYPDESGGSCTYAFETTNHLTKLGNNVSIFTGYPEKRTNDAFFPGITIYRDLEKKNLLKSAKSLETVLKSNHYDVIIFHSIISWFLYYLAVRLFNHRKTYTTLGIYHGPWYKEALLKFKGNKSYFKYSLVPVMRLLEYFYANSVDSFLFLSNYMKHQLANTNKRVLNKTSKIIPGGVNVAEFQRRMDKANARKILKIPENKFVIFSLRRLEYRMGIQNGIEAISRIPNDNIIFMVGGKGPYETVLKEKAATSGIDCVFLGYIPQDQLHLYFCAADLFLVPSIDLEGFGLVNLEALAMELPVLVTPQGGMKEIQGVFKYFYVSESNTVEDLAIKIKELQDNLRGTESFVDETIKRFDWSHITEEIYLYVKELAARTQAD
ncbi:glycosyltransferase family 4 protein [Paenibacillus sp.]|uniref:glycosyltransferase family 4 protein n=1 Tax=Paenibacillus sp. TaxID=58172 RepID=UPI002D25B4A1|nr:glycosyltransferase family 4 protein [Paenibacillus sp.]HZG86178.1 glycosyltransferase family 4 protein [Paenibacillus sp.]